MTDETTSEDPAGAHDTEGDFFDQPHGHDWLLSYFVFAAEGRGVKLPVTLYVNGTIVTGIVTTGAEFFRYTLNLLVGDQELAEGSIAEALKLMGDGFYGEDRGSIEPDNFKPVYIHLENARVFTGPTNPIPTEGTCWRGKLADVNGFNPGTFGVSE